MKSSPPPVNPPSGISRRSFLIGAGACAGLAVASRCSGRVWAQAQYQVDPFSLGVASGDPAPDGMVLWTKLAPDPLVGIGLGPADIPVRWQVASDFGMKKIVQQGTVMATAALGHSVHVEVEGLRPASHYWYQFESGGVQSPVGRTRTMPAPDSRPDKLRFAFASCQNWGTGFYAAYRQMTREDLDMVVHLGDYIYEGTLGGKNDRHTPVPDIVRPEPMNLAQYRLRYALYKLDPDLQAAHASFPFLMTWDDHEVENDYAGDRDQNGSPPAEFLIRRAAAYQAYYEHMPLRRTSIPRGPDMQLYRRLNFGDLAQFNVMDTRQYRSDQVPGVNRQVRSKESLDPARVFMGGRQADWLMTGLAKSEARWNVLAQQVMMAQFGRASANGPKYSMDSWDGYPADRQRLLDFLARTRPRNPIVLAGDSHTNLVADLKADFDRPESAVVGVQFAGTSISSTGVDAEAQKTAEADVAAQPHLKWFEGTKRGYVSCTVERGQWRSDVMQVANALDAASPVTTVSSWVVRDGEPGVHRA